MGFSLGIYANNSKLEEQYYLKKNTELWKKKGG